MGRFELTLFLGISGIVLIGFGWLGSKLYSKLFQKQSREDQLIKYLNKYIGQLELQSEIDKNEFAQEKANMESKMEELNQKNAQYLEEIRRLRSQNRAIQEELHYPNK